MSLRVPKAEPTELAASMEKRMGMVPAPLEAAMHSPQVAAAAVELGARAQEWDAADADLKSFAHMAVAAQVGCGWCLDYGYFEAQNRGLDLGKASQVPRWRESEAFTPLERDVLEYAEAVTSTPPTVSDELSGRLLAELGPEALVELTAHVAFSNLSTRMNVALGVESQGLSAGCELPLAAPPERVEA